MHSHRALAVGCLLVLLATGCDGESGSAENSATGTTRSGEETTKPESLVGVPQGKTLEMASGPTTARFAITALSPPDHTWDVEVDAPATADIAVRIVTWYGQRLRVLDSTRDKTSCRREGSRSHCALAFPRLEAQRAGTWTVVVEKRSQAKASVRMAVTFNSE
jgi:hypothetical protein